MGHERHFLTLCDGIQHNDDKSWAHEGHLFCMTEFNTKRSWNDDKSWAHEGHLFCMTEFQHKAFLEMMIRHGLIRGNFLTLCAGIQHKAFSEMKIHHGPMRDIFLALFNGIQHTAFLEMMIHHGHNFNPL